MNSLNCHAFKRLIVFCVFATTVSANLESCTTPSFENGLCVPYKECPLVKELIQYYGSYEGIPRSYLRHVFRSKCSKGKDPIQLCCKMPDNYLDSTTPITPQNDPTLTKDLDLTIDIKSQLNPQGLKILNGFICGADDGNRIAGGTKTNLAEFPWMALLRYDVPGNPFRCGGSLITNRYILTAAHCVNDMYYPLTGVRLGEHNLDTSPDCKQVLDNTVCMPPVEDFGIDKVIFHPKYSKPLYRNDIALIKLDRPVEFKIHIKPVCLPITKPAYEAQPDKFTIAGWGRTEVDNTTMSNILLKAENMTRQDNNACQIHYASHNIEISQKHICIADGKTGRDSCHGDSGGPLFVFGKYSEEKSSKSFVQYGIVAAGGKACNLEQKYPGIYTNVLTFLPWITNNIVY